MDKNDEFENCHKKLQCLVELGNILWSSNWNWTVVKQDIDFAEMSNGLFHVGVATFVNIVIHANRLERQNIGFAHINHADKSIAYNLARKLSVLNALQETMSSFSGDISNKVFSAVQNNDDISLNIKEINITNASNLARADKESHPENRNVQMKTNDVVKPKSPGKSSRFIPIVKGAPENLPVVPNIGSGNVNYNGSKAVQSVQSINNAGPGINLDRGNAVQMNPNTRCVGGNANVPFPQPPKTSPTPVVTFNPKTTVPLPITNHPKPPLQQLPSNIMAPVPHDVSNMITNNLQGNCFNPKPLMKTIFLNQNTISYNNCHIQQDSHMFNNHLLSYQSPNKSSTFINNEWITPTIFHDGFWTENKVKLWANQNDLIHLTPTGDGSKC